MNGVKVNMALKISTIVDYLCRREQFNCPGIVWNLPKVKPEIIAEYKE